MGSDARRDRLMKVLGPVVTAEGFDLEDVTITPAGRRRLVRVGVDRDGAPLVVPEQDQHGVGALLP